MEGLPENKTTFPIAISDQGEKKTALTDENPRVISNKDDFEPRWNEILKPKWR